MLELILLTFALMALIYLGFTWLNTKFRRTTSSIPGPPPPSNKDVGHMGEMARAGSLHEYLMELHSKFGPITGFWWGQTYVVSIASPEILKEHRHVFDRPPLLFNSFEILLGPKSIQYANGSDGKQRRKMHDSYFTIEKMPCYLHYLDQLAKIVETKWLEKGEDDQIPVSEESFTFAIQSALVIIMGDTFKDNKECVQFKSNYEKVWNEMERMIMNPSSQSEQSKEEFQQALTSIRTSVKRVIEQRRVNNLYQEGAHFIDVLIASCPDEETLVSDTVTYLVGSFHTTGNVLTWAFYYLATHPDVQDKLFEEVYNILGEKEYVNQYNFSDFIYLTQVIEETLRCSVLAPWAARFQDVDSELGGHKIPKNTPVIHALGVLLQDANIWPSPKKFDPQRFSPENMKKMSSYAFSPFGFAGKRKCPGFRFAYWEATVFLAMLVRRFEITMCGQQDIQPVHGLVTHPNEEIWVKITRRK